MFGLDLLTDDKVDAFVSAVNFSPREPCFFRDIPAKCVLSESEWSEIFHWRIVASDGASWLAEVERQLPFPLPPTLRLLVSRYLFPSFDAGPLMLYSVGCDRNEYTTEFRVAMRGDAIMWPFLLERGFLPFAKPAGGSYDPVCFDFRGSSRKTEPAVVRIDHEEILCYDRLRVLEIMAPGFDVMLEEVRLQLRNAAAKEPSA
jgi:SMI1 / KNR4 family (SUKH-1)